MNAPAFLSRRAFLASSTLAVAFSVARPGRAKAAPAIPSKSLDPSAVDSYLSIDRDGKITLFCGKVDLGQGLRIAMRQIAAEELGVAVDRIDYVEGDTALTPDQGRTSGSNGVQRGGMQVRRAAATLRAALVEKAAQKLNAPAETLVVGEGRIATKDGGASVRFSELLESPAVALKLDPKAPLRAPASYKIVGKSLPRPDVPAKCVGAHVFMHDFKVDGMLHGRVVRPPSNGAELVAVDEASIAAFKNARIVRIRNFLAVVADDEWTAIRAASALKTKWSGKPSLPDQARLPEALRKAGPVDGEKLVAKGASAALPGDARSLKATYFWPAQSHASLGPSCAIADVGADAATIWTASQGTHGNRATFARFLKLPPEKVRLIYLDGAGCYGMNGHEDAAADAAIVSRAVGRPVRVQWSREDELAFDPKGPPQLIDVAAAIDAAGAVLDWRTDLWIPETTKGMPYIPRIGPTDAGLDDVKGMNPGLIAANADPPYRAAAMSVHAHWLKDTPLRPAPLRGPGKPGNCFAVECFADELAFAAKVDPLEFRLRAISDPRGLETLKRLGAMMDWRGAPKKPTGGKGLARGRGISYVHYKHSETYVAMGVELVVDRQTGVIAVEKVWCAHDCGQIVNPDGVRAQVEGCIIQTLSRTLLEEALFDRSRVTSTSWSSYPVLRFPQVPRITIELIDRPNEPPLGAGEAACSCVPAAVGNAVFDATGVRLRTIPMTPRRVLAAMRG